MLACCNNTHCVKAGNPNCIKLYRTIRIMEEPKDRLKALREARRYRTATDAAHAYGWPVSTYVAKENGRRGVTRSDAERFAKAYRSTPEYILFGSGINQGDNGLSRIYDNSIEPVCIPLLDCADIEQFRSIATGAIPMSNETVFLPNTIEGGRRVFSIEVYDKSMESSDKSSLFLGEKAFFNPDIAYASGDIIIAVVPGYAKALIRKYRQTAVDADGAVSYDLAALNPDFDSVKDAHTRQAVIVARAIGAYRTL
jgi:SOS-response transcriptional repressor LexA